MNFADCLHKALETPRTARLRKPLAQALLGLAGLAALPFLSGASSFAGQSARVLAALAGATFLAFVALRLLARRHRVAIDLAPLKILARTSLSPKNGLALVEAQGQRFFLAYGDGFTQLLSSQPASAAGCVEGDPR